MAHGNLRGEARESSAWLTESPREGVGEDPARPVRVCTETESGGAILTAMSPMWNGWERLEKFQKG